MNRKRGSHSGSRGLPALVTISILSVAVALPRGRASQKPEASKATSAPAGQQIFSSTCAGCHGLDGRGGEHAPNIATGSNVQTLADVALLHVIRNGIPGAGMPGFGSSLDDNQLSAVVSYVRVLQGNGQAVSVQGSAERGRSLFFGSAKCSECHMIGGQGGFIGADLSGYGRTHSVGELRDAITSPNKNLDPRRGTVVVHTRNGRIYTGVARNEDNFSLQLQTLDGTFHLFDKAGLARVEHEPQSLMPARYGSTLSASDLNDLVSYLMKAAVSQAGWIREDE